MKDKITQGLEGIRNSSPKARMRWVVAFTSITMILVLFIWVKSIDDVIDIARPSTLLSIERKSDKNESMIHRLRVRTAQTMIYFQQKFS